MKHNFQFLIFVVAISACATKEPFSDSVLMQIAEYKDRRMTDSLLFFFGHDDANYRREAALAFGSVQDSIAVERLGELLLRDTAQAIQRAAAFALGQTPVSRSARILQEASQRIKQPYVLEALGKSSRELRPTAETTTDNDFSLAGLAWMHYRYGLKYPFDSLNDRHILKGLEQGQPEETRFATASLFARGIKNLDAFESQLLLASQHEPSAEVRMNIVSALRKLTSDSALATLKKIIQSDKDYRVRINAVRALQSFPIEKTFEALKHALKDENINVSIACSEVIKSHNIIAFENELSSLVSSIENWRVRGNVYDALLKANPRQSLAEELQQQMEDATNPYIKASLLAALQHYVPAHNFITETLLRTDVAVMKSAAASSLTAMIYNKSIDQAVKKSLLDNYVKVMQQGDVAVIGIVAEVFADTALHLNKIISDFSFLYDAKNKLSLPKDIEALQPLEKAIAYFEGKTTTEIKNPSNHHIDWPLVKSIAKDQRVKIKTSKGNIIIQLLVEETPGSAANFVSLLKQHYFDNKFFHRVVPNFVVQAGCHRGDGWGSEDYSIRSEFTTRKFKTGSVGMASAGKDTEGTQWFITHSPTPHLDGRYTIFAEVTEGMETVHRLEVGDKIISVELL